MARMLGPFCVNCGHDALALISASQSAAGTVSGRCKRCGPTRVVFGRVMGFAEMMDELAREPPEGVERMTRPPNPWNPCSE